MWNRIKIFILGLIYPYVLYDFSWEHTVGLSSTEELDACIAQLKAGTRLKYVFIKYKWAHIQRYLR
jgi:hypothetical protein